MHHPSPKLQNTYDYENAAYRTLLIFKTDSKDILSDNAFGYYDSAACDEITKKQNIASFQRITLLPRVLIDVSTVDTNTAILGEKLSFPLMVAPMAVQKMAHVDGEMGVSRACKKHGKKLHLLIKTNFSGIIMTLSSISAYTMEKVGEAMDSGPTGTKHRFLFLIMTRLSWLWGTVVPALCIQTKGCHRSYAEKSGEGWVQVWILLE